MNDTSDNIKSASTFYSKTVDLFLALIKNPKILAYIFAIAAGGQQALYWGWMHDYSDEKPKIVKDIPRPVFRVPPKYINRINKLEAENKAQEIRIKQLEKIHGL